TRRGWPPSAGAVHHRRDPEGIRQPAVSASRGSAVTTDEECVRLRPVQAGDLPRMYDLQSDPESNRMAVTIPRSAEAFHSHWAKALADPGATTRAILLG